MNSETLKLDNTSSASSKESSAFFNFLLAIKGMILKLVAEDFAFAFLVTFLIILLSYPAFISFSQTPMIQTSWELQDPAPSLGSFLPGQQVVRHELLNHQNILWSNIRNMGAPILANEISAAPIFPLTLIFFWLPQYLFWTCLIVSRLLLMGAGSVLIARQILGFNRTASVVFSLAFIFNIHVLRWMNHSWQNGLTAGIWYIFCLAKMSEASTNEWGKKRFYLFLGTSLSVYSLLTCGFPEASALCAILTILTFTVPFLAQIYKKELVVSRFLFDGVASHIVGFGFASIQIFSLVEYISTMPSFRTAIGIVQFDSLSVFKTTLSPFTYMPPSGPLIHYFGFIPVFLFIWGLAYTLFYPKKINRYDIAALSAGAFYLLKLFPFWPDFNQFIGTLPVLKSSWFIVYFLPILLWFFSYYCAKGAHFIFSLADLRNREGLFLRYLTTIGASILTLFLIINVAGKAPIIRFGVTARLGIIFVIFLGLMSHILGRVTLPKLTPPPKLQMTCALLLFLLIAEGVLSRPRAFMEISKLGSEYKNEETSAKILKLLKEKKIPVAEVRERGSWAVYGAAGIGSVDNGTPAIQPARTLALRTNFFKTIWGGLMPIEGETTPYSWQLTSGAYFLKKIPLSAKSSTLSKESKNLDILGKIEGDQYLVRDPQTLSRAYLPTLCLAAADMASSVNLVKDIKHFKLGYSVLENLDASQKAFCANYSHPLKKVQIAEDTGSHVKLSPVQGPTLLMLNDTFYSGWEAMDRISGKKFEIKPANINFRGLILPEKRTYQIEFHYKPIWLSWVYLLLFSSTLIVGLLGVKTYRKSQTLSLPSPAV